MELKWRVKSYVHKDDYYLLCLADRPTQNTAPDAFEALGIKNFEAKSSIILILAEKIMEKQERLWITMTNNTKELWEELRRLYFTYNLKVIKNLRKSLNALVLFKQKESLDKFISKFLRIIDELGSYDEEISDVEMKKSF